MSMFLVLGLRHTSYANLISCIIEIICQNAVQECAVFSALPQGVFFYCRFYHSGQLSVNFFICQHRYALL